MGANPGRVESLVAGKAVNHMKSGAMNKHLRSFQILLLSCGLCLFIAQPLVALAAAESSSKSNAGTLLGVIEKGTLRVGVSLFTPWALKTKEGQLIGFEINVTKRLAEYLRVNTKFKMYTR